MWIAIITIGALALIAGTALSFASRQLPSNEGNLVEQVNELLPQTQCAQCGYAGCRPYAAAVVAGDAAINLCPPGGDETCFVRTTQQPHSFKNLNKYTLKNCHSEAVFSLKNPYTLYF